MRFHTIDNLKEALRAVPAGVLLFFLALRPLNGQEAWTPVAEGFPQTTAEVSGFTATTSHLEMWQFLEDLSAASTDMRLGTYGKSWEGRELPFAVFSKPLVSEPWEAWALGRPIVLLAANVHGGERTFREGLLLLMRDFATPGTAANDLLDKVTVLVAPQINPDGYEASERGTRGNAWGIDLNRDYVKLEQPALANYVTNLIGAWRPHMFVDSHNGGSRPYNLCYQCGSHYDPAQEITLLCDQGVFPAIDAKLEGEGKRSWYYSGGDEEAWRGGGYEARIARNYGAFINSVGILFEAPGQELEVGARAGYLGNLAVVEYAVSNAEKLMDLVAAARMETIEMGLEPRGEIAVEMEYGPEDYTVDYTIITGGGRRDPPGTPVDTIEVTGAQLLKKPIATKLRPRPYAYLLPRDAVDAVGMLKRHGITVEVLTEADSLTVDAYTVAGVSYERAYNHAAATVVEVGEVVTTEQEFPVGTFVIPTAQFLGRLAAHMLEPESDDNVVYWNTMDAWIPRPAGEEEQAELPPGVDPDDPQVQAFMRRQAEQGPPLVPIYKLMEAMPLPTRLLEGGR
ncbi:MAG: M14 family zinc carboxypeptidase [Gemmatimonadota bacterium]